MAAPVLIRRSFAVCLLALLAMLSHADQARADEVPVCSMSREEFVEAALPNSNLTNFYGGRLVKYAQPPGLVVLAQQERSSTSKEVESAFAEITRDDVALPSRMSFLTYSNFAEVAKLVQQFGDHHIFIFIAEKPTDPSELEQFRLALGQIMRSSRDVDALAEQSKRTGWFTSRSQVDFGTAEIISTAAVVSSRSEDTEIGMIVHLAYYAAIAASASSTESYLRRFFTRTSDTDAELTDFGRRFFRVFSDNRVKNGATKDSFVECSG
jgi:hypothetical protein